MPPSDRIQKINAIAEQFGASIVCLHDEVMISGLANDKVEEFWKAYSKYLDGLLRESLSRYIGDSIHKVGKEVFEEFADKIRKSAIKSPENGLKLLPQYEEAQRKENGKAFIKEHPEVMDIWAESLRYRVWVAEQADLDKPVPPTYYWDPEGVWDPE